MTPEMRQTDLPATAAQAHQCQPLPASGLTAAFAHAATATADMRVEFDNLAASMRHLQKLCDRAWPGAARYRRRQQRLRRYRQAGRYRRHVGRVR